MNCTIETMKKEHWESVARIYQEGINRCKMGKRQKDMASRIFNRKY